MSRVDSELRQSEAFSRQNPQRSPVHQNLFNIWDRQHSCISIKLELALSVRDESIASPADVYDVGGQDSTSTEMYWWLSVIVLFRGNVRASVFASRWIVKDCVNRPTIRHAVLGVHGFVRHALSVGVSSHSFCATASSIIAVCSRCQEGFKPRIH